MYIRPRERGGGLTELKIADLVFSLALLVALNVVYYLNLPHHVTGAIISAGQAAMFSGFVGLAVFKGHQVNSLVPHHRVTLMREILSLNHEIAELRSTGQTHTLHYGEVLQAKETLSSIDKLIEYEEEVVDPLSILGAPAGPNAVGLISGSLGAAFAAAIQGYLTAKRSYAADGSFTGPEPPRPLEEWIPDGLRPAPFPPPPLDVS